MGAGPRADGWGHWEGRDRWGRACGGGRGLRESGESQFAWLGATYASKASKGRGQRTLQASTFLQNAPANACLPRPHLYVFLFFLIFLLSGDLPGPHWHHDTPVTPWTRSRMVRW